MPRVNPDILRWARETAGLTLEEASKKLHINEARGISAVDRLVSLEVGESEPTRPMLVKMAKQYRRPLLVFYISAPPRKGNRGQDFRTLPEEYSVAADALLDALIRDVQSRQSIVRAVLEDEEEAEPLPFIGSMEISDGVPAVIASIQKIVQINLAEFHEQTSPEDAFALLRSAVETVGVYVLLISNLGSYHSTIDLETFRGYSLADDIAPFIIINDQDSRAAWSFTLVHELSHLWLGQTGVSGAWSEKTIEQFCNDVASEFLLPWKELVKLEVNDATDFEESKARISDFARARNLSSSMVAYKLLRNRLINQNTWFRLSKAFRIQWHDMKSERRSKAQKQKGGPNYFTVRRHHVGNALIALVRRTMSGGALTTSKAGKVLGVKAKNVQALINIGGSSSTIKVL